MYNFGEKVTVEKSNVPLITLSFNPEAGVFNIVRFLFTYLQTLIRYWRLDCNNLPIFLRIFSPIVSELVFAKICKSNKMKENTVLIIYMMTSIKGFPLLDECFIYNSEISHLIERRIFLVCLFIIDYCEV